ncbi:MAG: Flagellar biosynthetic protein FliR [Phenylobacterium sp.]|jgi:flagellar biosynthetic protein FliR|uniref:flagellar biosynthetic protein FliR n=1 Tax=Phenylobacterium sp. TaxID=1871053 RepID=UPI002608506B|nr:flagellar biosynthetic protein FliR [Phenylobacterium sp.]MDB5426038.1 Flagellar biosynthetic protein FliR [Phenylobacterium sp.]MDB5437322.1 Flagellar biosynthetic protein FliR [Phenylobacterium sp.]MDB5463357.1 Flagellar biosynthetic protein FliR [Phenylobacterium sp.]MDB5497010.1 Flagellar biosynthetic protein FliR [Phenylobacterium sp.]
MEHYATAQQVFVAGLVFARLGAIVMLIPGIGETFIPVRIRLSLALLLALVMLPVVGGGVPPIPTDVSGVAVAIIKETAIGLMIGGILRFFMSSLAAAGEIVSIQTTLAFAQTANPMQAAPSTTLGTFLGLMGLLLIMTTNLHHLFLSAIVRSYTIFPFSRAVPLADANALAIQTVSKSFALGLQLAAPVVALSLIFNVATGLVGRVMPQFQIFFVATPLMVLLGLSVFALSLGTIGMVWVDRYRDLIGLFG